MSLAMSSVDELPNRELQKLSQSWGEVGLGCSKLEFAQDVGALEETFQARWPWVSTVKAKDLKAAQN